MPNVTEDHDSSQLDRHAPEVPHLTAKQQLALAALLEGASDAEAAKKAKTTRETVNRWRNQSAEFRAALSYERAAVWSRFHDSMNNLLSKATRTLETALDDDDPKIRLKAVQMIMQHSVASSPICADDIRASWGEDAHNRSIALLLAP